jgi:hypothetical protein
LIIAERFSDAFDFAKNALRSDVENEYVAAYLLQAAAFLKELPDPFDLIPPALREREEVTLSRAMYFKVQQKRPAWWEYSRRLAKRFPDNSGIQFVAAESHLDEATHDGEFTRALDDDLRSRLNPQNSISVCQSRPRPDRSFTPTYPTTLGRKPIAATLTIQPQQARTRGKIPITPAAPPRIRPAISCLGAFWTPAARARGRVRHAGVQKPAQTRK